MMTRLSPVPNFRLVLDDSNLFPAALLKHGRLYGHILKRRRADLDHVTVFRTPSKHGIKFKRCIDITGNFSILIVSPSLTIYCFPGFNHCNHTVSYGLSGDYLRHLINNYSTKSGTCKGVALAHTPLFILDEHGNQYDHENG